MALLLRGIGFTAFANPVGMTVQAGTASTSLNGPQLSIAVSPNAFLNWNSFNIAPGETTTFVQPSASSIVWNRINDANPSQILGHLNANGVVVLMNQSGFFFGPNSVVNAAGMIVSTAPVTPVESSAGMFWQFNGAPPQASIVNYGQIKAGRAGSLFLIADHIENHGTLQAPEGNIGLVAGREVLLTDRPDGRGLSATVRLPSGSVENSGRLIADAGTIALNAQVVNQRGLVQANSIRERNGIIELIASDSVALSETSVLSAQGDPTRPSPGGQIEIKSAGSFTDSTASYISVAGGAQAGNGGFVEISAPVMTSIQSQINGHARAGSIGGRLSIDPTDIVISYSGSGSIGSGSVGSSDPPTTLKLDVNSAFAGFSQINLQATRNINLASGTTWDLVASTGIDTPGSLLKLEAGKDITIEDNASLVAGWGWSVSLQAGRDFSQPNTVKPGKGNITLAGSGSIETQDGSIHLLAGNNVTLASGYVRTINGGSITAEAVAGDVISGTRPNGFLFLPTGYQVDADLGGLSTGNGGDVNLTAGNDIISYLPVETGFHTDGGSGAFGAQPGNVTLVAGHDVYGHFVVRNGSGTITAGRDAGKRGTQLDKSPGEQPPDQTLALSVVDGGWEVSAGGFIFLQEVRNPNGTFNRSGIGSSTTKHYFDYSPDAYTVLRANAGVQLLGTALPRNDFEADLPSIYPGRLEITAGAEGVILGNDVVLFPSATGNLRITTTDGGSLVSTKPGGDLANLILSESGKNQYRASGDFGVADHGSTVLHLDDAVPVQLDISGDMKAILLGVPKRAEINVHGDMINSRFDGQNVQPTDVTRINVAGDIINRNEFTSVSLAAAPDFSLLDLAHPPLSGAVAGLGNQFYYSTATHQLTFQGRMDGFQVEALKNLSVRVLDANGQPVVNANGEPVTRQAQILDAAIADDLYARSQDVPLNPDTGYRIGGGGKFIINARNLDLGATAGIRSQGPRANAALANYFTRGADINISLAGNLDMFSTTISSLNGGEVAVVAGGTISVGSKDFIGNDAVARGIFTVDPSSVTVIARGDINVNGSRIAAYDGGRVTVRSLEGNVDAGTGGLGSVAVEKIYVDPATRTIKTYTPTIPGSGILATTFPTSLDPTFPASVNNVGDILVETPRGSIIASAGGVVQIPLNGVGNNLGTVTLRAGTKDASGKVVYVGNIDASGSGVIGSTVQLEASGDIKGVVFARENLDVSAQQNVSVTALAVGNANVSAGQSVSGTIIGVGSVNASGTAVDAALLSQNVSTSGNVSSGQVGFSQGTAANATSQSLQKEDPEKMAASARGSDDDEEFKKKTVAALPRLTRTTGRVTVVLPKP
jgi:filamentous hemagglutinin family protein